MKVGVAPRDLAGAAVFAFGLVHLQVVRSTPSTNAAICGLGFRVKG